MLAFSLTGVVGLCFRGALLSRALIIFPAETTRQVTNRMTLFVFVVCATSLLAVAAGFVGSLLIFKMATVGQTIVIVSLLLFVLSLLK